MSLMPVDNFYYLFQNKYKIIAFRLGTYFRKRSSNSESHRANILS